MKMLNNSKYPDNKTAFWFLLPCLLGCGIFIIIPVFFSFGLSFCDWNLLSLPKFTGLDRTFFRKRILVSFDKYAHICRIYNGFCSNNSARSCRYFEQEIQIFGFFQDRLFYTVYYPYDCCCTNLGLDL